MVDCLYNDYIFSVINITKVFSLLTKWPQLVFTYYDFMVQRQNVSHLLLISWIIWLWAIGPGLKDMWSDYIFDRTKTLVEKY